MADFPPTHPGEVLLEDFLRPMGMTARALADSLGMAEADLGPILYGVGPITPDVALRLARYFGTSAEFWAGMQTTFDLGTARDRLGAEIDATVRGGFRNEAQRAKRSGSGRPCQARRAAPAPG